MTDSVLQLGLYLTAAAVLGAVLGWLIRGTSSKGALEKLNDKWHVKFDDAARQRDRFNSENAKLRSSIEAQQTLVNKHELAASKMRTGLESATEKIKSLSKDVFSLTAERDELRGKFNNSHQALNTANQQVAELEAEFIKAGSFYKSELEKAFDKRKSLQKKVEDAKLEHESLSNLLQASRSENESVGKMLVSAQTRLDNLDALEQRAIELEAENAELRHDATRTRQEMDALRRDVAEFDELRIQNKELAHCLRSMENSRKQYERDALRYREQADQSEKQTETLRMKLDDVEQSFADMAKQHDEALKIARKEKAAKTTNGQTPAEQEVDDLTEIVGVGKVFQQTLNDLGIFSYRQIASFDASDVARVNMQLKEFKGRMEQDDWIGQAKELHFKKYGVTEEH
jgi:predicted flap endonuclease-1-like 5' DNA nuclease